jgi:predicted ATP-dependent serine protease
MSKRDRLVCCDAAGMASSRLLRYGTWKIVHGGGTVEDDRLWIGGVPHMRKATLYLELLVTKS